jgi:hypothetical protein
MPDDLSLQHDPVSDFLACSPSPDGGVLTPAQVTQFHSQGFVAGIPLLDPVQVEQLQSQLSPLLVDDPCPLWYEFNRDESSDTESALFHALGAWRIAAAFHDLLWHPRFVRAAEQLLDGPVRFWHDQLFCKPAGHGGVVSWHQDYSYWSRTTPIAHLTCWIALDDTSLENGVIQFIPGSHLWDLLPVTGLAGDMESIREVLSVEQWEALSNPTHVPMKKGECSFHHPLTVHGSTRNHSPDPRRATVINVIRDGVRSATEEPLLTGIPVIPKGECLQGQFFPLLSGQSR